MEIKAKYVLVATAVLAMVAVLVGCSQSSNSSQATVVTDSVAVESVAENMICEGVLVSEKAVDVVSRVDGVLLRKHYSDGDFVKAGQVLFSMEANPYVDRVRQAEADLESARSAYEYASSRHAAVKRAMESDAVSQMELALAESNMEQAAASIKSAEAALRMARFELGLCTIKAPVSGRISASTVNPGSYVDGDDTAFVLATIYDDGALTAVFRIADKQLIDRLRANANTPLTLAFDEPLNNAYAASVSYISPTIDPTDGTVLLKAKVANPHGELRHGMPVSINIARL